MVRNAGPSTAPPGFPVEYGGADGFRAALFKENRIRGCRWHSEAGDPDSLRSG